MATSSVKAEELDDGEAALLGQAKPQKEKEEMATLLSALLFLIFFSSSHHPSLCLL